MSRHPKSRSVSWDDESPTICSPNAKSLYSNQGYDDTLSDVYPFYNEVGVLPKKKIKSMDKSFESLYKPFPLDRQTIKWLPGQPNKALRWRVMS